MRKFYFTRLKEEARYEALQGFPGFTDPDQCPEEILEEVHRLLKPLGLEVQLAYPGDTSTLFRIVKKGALR